MRFAIGVVHAVIAPVAGCPGLTGSARVVGLAQGDAPAIGRPRIASPRALNRSATLAMEGWCAGLHLAADLHLVALRLPRPDKRFSTERRIRRAIGPDEALRYRRVRLGCGAHVFSKADNRYVPSRLKPAINAARDTTRTPFGLMVRPLAPVRLTIAQRSRPAPERPGADEPLFEIDPPLLTGAAQPSCGAAGSHLGRALPAAPP